MKPNFKQVVQGVRACVTKNSPQILLTIGIVGMGATVVYAVKATPKALEKIEEKKAELGVDKLTVADTVKTTWKCYLPAGVTAALSTACLISSNSISTRRTAALGAAYNITKLALEEYKDAVVETVGENAAKEIKKKAVEKHIENNAPNPSNVVVIGDTDFMCKDAISKEEFLSNINKIERAVNKINRMIVSRTEMCATLNDFYEELGLETTEWAEKLGWHLDDGEIEVEFESDLTKDYKPCLVFTFNVPPRYDYWKLN